MSIHIKAGTRLKSAVCETQIMVIKAPAGEYDLRCGGEPMLAMDATRCCAPGAVPAVSAWTAKCWR